MKIENFVKKVIPTPVMVTREAITIIGGV